MSLSCAPDCFFPGQHVCRKKLKMYSVVRLQPITAALRPGFYWGSHQCDSVHFIWINPYYHLPSYTVWSALWRMLQFSQMPPAVISAIQHSQCLQPTPLNTFILYAWYILFCVYVSHYDFCGCLPGGNGMDLFLFCLFLSLPPLCNR